MHEGLGVGRARLGAERHTGICAVGRQRPPWRETAGDLGLEGPPARHDPQQTFVGQDAQGARDSPPAYSRSGWPSLPVPLWASRCASEVYSDM